MRGAIEQICLITQIRLKNWRNFVDAQAELHRRTFLAGPNASGKTNFLDAVRFLRDLAAEGGGLQEAVRKRGGLQRLRCLAARQFSDVAILIRAGSGENRAEWEYELHFNQEKLPSPAIKLERLSRMGEDVVLRPDESDAAEPERLTETCLEQGRSYKETRQLATFLRSVRYVNVIPQLVREPCRDSTSDEDPYGAGLLERMAGTLPKSRTARLRRILEAILPAVPHLEELDIHRDGRGRPHLRARYKHWRAKGAWQTEDQFSDGTLRLIGLLWAVLESPGPLLVEEPELSLHPQVVRLVPAILTRLQRRSNCQLLLTTHSPDLVEGEGIGAEEVLLLAPEDESATLRKPLALTEVGTLLRTGTGFLEATRAENDVTPERQMGLFSE